MYDQEKIDKLRDKAGRFIIDNMISLGVFLMIDEIDHVENMIVSLISARDGYGHQPGSFIQAVLDNDLRGAFGRADHVNRKALIIIVSAYENIS